MAKSIMATKGEHPTTFTMRVLRAEAMREVIAMLKDNASISDRAKSSIIDDIEQLIQKGN